jgi:hypothetical protein
MAALGTTLLPTTSSGRQKRTKKQKQQQNGTVKRLKQHSLLDLDTSLNNDTDEKRSTGRSKVDNPATAGDSEENRRRTRSGSVYQHHPVIL